MEVSGSGPPAKEVDARSAQASSRGTGQQEPEAPSFNQEMDLLQEHGEFLDLIHDDQRVAKVPGLQFLPHPCRVGAQVKENPVIQKV